MIINSIYNTQTAKGVLWVMAADRIYCPENVIFNLVTKLVSNLFPEASTRIKSFFFFNKRSHGCFSLITFKIFGSKVNVLTAVVLQWSYLTGTKSI